MAQITEQLCKVFPHLRNTATKGEAGVIGVIGGSYEYTGAPYYTAISALKMGADLVHIFCSKQAAGPIKTYSPQAVVHPLFLTSNQAQQPIDNLQTLHNEWLQTLQTFYPRISSWVVGPGLGRDPYMHYFFPKLIRSFPKQTVVIIDADGLYFTCQFPELVPELSRLRTILTPNHREFMHVNKILKLECEPLPDNTSSQVLKLKSGVNTYVTIIKKGEADEIINQQHCYIVRTHGSSKRCGGIGDILAGCIATSSGWDFEYGPVLACHVVRLASKAAFEKEGRSLTAPGIIQELCPIIKSLEKGKLKEQSM